MYLMRILFSLYIQFYESYRKRINIILYNILYIPLDVSVYFILKYYFIIIIRSNK